MRHRLGHTLAPAVLVGILATLAEGAEPTSQACARWEDNYRDLVVQAAALLGLLALATAWLLPFVMAATGRAFRFALGLTGRCFWPGAMLALAGLLAFALFVLPGPLRGELSALQIQAEYFPAAAEPAKSAAPARPPSCTSVNFSKRGLLLGVGAGETLAAQPFLVVFLLTGAAAAGAILARIAYFAVGRFRSPLGRGRRAAIEARRLVS